MNGTTRIAVDTSVAIPLLVASHEAHRPVRDWARGRRLSLSGHALAETYAVLTRLPADARVSAEDAVALIDDRFPEVLALSANSAITAHRRLASLGIAGGAVYDGLVALAALENGALLATRDARTRDTYEAVGVAVEVVAAG
ncbi:PIN domain-containing protein [Actinomyces qiguomingii]|uniref:PIN domain-containing protein n=1 Tax=Actinomyces qiguomingii TaxID=2057800 RepID=UPI000CA0236D|nr:PIN domain-containing protein [Actinomyces qiguomingii]